MKKIAVISCNFQHNYGSMLQAFATLKILDILGYCNETICIDEFKNKINHTKISYLKKKMFSPDVIKDKLEYICFTIKK